MSRRTIIGLIFVVIVIVAVVRYEHTPHFGDHGRLHVEANGQKAPYVDIAKDRESLRLLVTAFDQPTQQHIVAKYGELVAADKLISVDLDTAVVIEQQIGDDCGVRVIGGKDTGKAGWVPCSWIVK